ncbi:bifunctional UDP-N-acetylglucosamine diphosphorylase/glucosamine-1-phosphate N-acetyltransferase GlmU [Caulobacter sp. S45]|uniref:bifunctional UDP-N-acetylglucosamine diphosphorylase/glucosamine-1-phosphate N-acetyltransferase GlmU n=1 Tax=Caulobacter sp. S45 TaxID=1641861 RepID=UPI002112C1CA|nr:bifunctional UDP-N-acetylglucosamine diphosphorylase/glucosamine-1-phosphate N-acetyltransferase GlmU [Caulobacter sp. S45]
MADPAPPAASARAVVILAAGQGTRMCSPTPKVLHRLAGRTLLDVAIDTAQTLGAERIVVVAGAHSPLVAAHAVKRLGEGAISIQNPPLGTGHAVRAAETALAGFTGDVVVTYADTPLLDAAAVEPLFAARRSGAALAVLGFEAADPGAYGRLVMEAGGGLGRIVEAKEADAAERAIRLCNAGVIAAPAPLLFELLGEVTNANAKAEYYLTDVVGLARGRGLQVAAVLTDEVRTLGVNSQAELATAEAYWQANRRHEALAAGVSMPAPDTVIFAHDTVVEGGVLVEPHVVFAPGVKVRSGAVIRAFSHLEGADVQTGAIVGPYARLRPGAQIGEGAHVGNFVEVKNATLGAGAKANHLAYLGDGEVGARANIGAGVIFCNYDGFDKHHTSVGEDAFVGSDTALVAPVRIGARAMTGSGSVITRDVADDALALERGPQVEKPGWASRFRARKLAARSKP